MDAKYYSKLFDLIMELLTNYKERYGTKPTVLILYEQHYDGLKEYISKHTNNKYLNELDSISGLQIVKTKAVVVEVF